MTLFLAFAAGVIAIVAPLGLWLLAPEDTDPTEHHHDDDPASWKD